MTTYVRSNMCELIFMLYVVFDFTDIHFVTAYDEVISWCSSCLHAISFTNTAMSCYISLGFDMDKGHLYDSLKALSRMIQGK